MKYVPAQTINSCLECPYRESPEYADYWICYQQGDDGLQIPDTPSEAGGFDINDGGIYPLCPLIDVGVKPNKLTTEQQAAYVANPKLCPHCGNKKLSYDDEAMPEYKGETELLRAVTCHGEHCGHSWYETFTLTAVQEDL
jgi:hypothetical protein